MKKFAYLFKYLQTQKEKQQYYHKRGSEALQRQGCMWLSAALMCVLACPLADTAVTAVTCQQEEKPLPKTVFHKKVLLTHTHPAINAINIIWGIMSGLITYWFRSDRKKHTVWNLEKFFFMRNGTLNKKYMTHNGIQSTAKMEES